jgi:hypothetical protein
LVKDDAVVTGGEDHTTRARKGEGSQREKTSGLPTLGGDGSIAHSHLGVHFVPCVGHQGLVFSDSIREHATDKRFVLSSALQLNDLLFDLDQPLNNKLLEKVGVLGGLGDQSKLGGAISLQLLQEEKTKVRGAEEQREMIVHPKVHVLTSSS